MATAMAVLSGSSSYCTAAQFLQRYDARTIGDLVSDDGTRVAAGSLAGNTIIGKLLMQNSGKVEAACLIGEKYNPTDLDALAASATNMTEFLAGLVAALTVESVFRRRPNPDMVNFPETDEAERLLNAISEGKRIFGFQETADAGHMYSEVEDSGDVRDRKMATTRASRLFGRRNNAIDSPPYSAPYGPP